MKLMEAQTGEGKKDFPTRTFRCLRRVTSDIIKEMQLRFYSYNTNPNKKILGYWDFSKRGESVGDFIVFIEILDLLRTQFNLDLNRRNIDFCFIDDKNHHNQGNIFVSKTHGWKKNIKSLTIINPYIDTIFYFHSNYEFERFYAKNRKNYIIWPGEVMRDSCDASIIDSIHKKKKIMPKLVLPVEIISNVYDFYKSEVYPAKPIVLNIRKNTRDTERNSNLIELKKFLKHYEKNKHYKFIIICEKVEIPEDFRKLKNVIFSKDYFADIEYDATLITTSYLSIFPSSGMAMFAWLTDTPFIHYGKHGLICPSIPPKGKKFSFFSEYQRFYHGPETAKWLISQFEKLIKDLKENNINNNLRSRAQDNKKYLARF